MNYKNFFSSMSDAELREKADDIYADVIDASRLCPETPWHEACFAALLAACLEMQARNMAPPKAVSGAIQ